jgi:hypothetical protein
MLALTLSFLTPRAALVAVAVALPLAAFGLATLRNRRARALLRLAAPPRDRTVTALLAVPLLLGLAAAEPVLRTHTGRKVRLDAQAIFVFDTSRSMAASAGAGAPTRLQLARSAALRLRRDALADIPSGVASLTTQLLPHLFPSTDEAAFATTVRNVVDVEQPPPPALDFGVPGTSFSALQNLRNQGFFAPWSRRRVAILLTDGESGPYSPQGVGAALVGDSPPTSFTQQYQPLEAPVPLVIVRVGGAGDRIHLLKGAIEATYRPDPRAPQIVAALAAATHGRAYTADETGPAARTVRALLGSGDEATRGVRVRTIDLAPWVAAAALAALLVVLRRRNLVAV